MFKVTNLNKYYYKNKPNENHVLKDITLEFPETGLVTIFGESGCGKTTLLNVLGLLDKFDSGVITIDGIEYKSYKPNLFDEIRNKKIGYIFQNYNLLPTSNVYDNVALPLTMLGITDKDEIERRVTYSLSKVGLEKFRRRNSQMLSGGQQQRVAIARAIAKNPDIIIADEPTGNLDSNNTFEVMNIIKKISKDRLVILVSHEKNLVDYYSDRIIEIKDGAIVSDRLNKGESLNHKDTRNIYLKDYELSSSKDNNLNLSFYKDENSDELNVDFIYRNGEIYIKSKENKKIHIVDELSEVKLLDASAEEFNQNMKDLDSDFNLDELGDASSFSTKTGGYVSFFGSIKKGFSKTHNFIKRSKLTIIAFIITTVIFVFNLASITSTLSFSKKEFLTTSENTVIVNISNAEAKDGKSIDSIKEMFKNDSNIISIRDASFGILFEYIDVRNFYAKGQDVMVPMYFVPNEKYNYTITTGSDISGEYDMLISSWAAEMVLKSSQAKSNGITSANELIGLKMSLYVMGEYLDFTVKGVTTEDSYATIISKTVFDKMNGNLYSYSSNDNKIYIETTNKEDTINKLESSFKRVFDAVEDGRKEYLLNTLSNNLMRVITLVVMAIALMIYILLIVRASMFRKIKEIGVLRTIGARRRDVINIFMGEMIALTTKTSLVAYVITTLFILFFKSQVDLSDLGISLLKVNPLSILIGIVLIYLVNIISAVLPVLFLTRKTPIEITKKYDI
ncbi:MAG: ABC transporter ATP-binding protein/permease [Gammaproteobacteria bacterium]|nr:ABC transporter ATP-binding protein/permease [Gammaproteobacteria bacterium]